MDGLRWILLLIGAAIVGAIYVLGTRREAQARLREEAPDGDGEEVVDLALEAASDSLSTPGAEGPVLDESMERELARLGQLIAEDRAPGQSGDSDPAVAASASPTGGTAATDPDEPVGDPVALPDNPEKIVTLMLQGAGTARLHGTDIDKAAEKVGLTFGAQGIYHRMMDRGDQPLAVFSMANITNPGTFDRKTLATTFTPGLCLFMTLPNELSALDSWDAMHAAGQRLAELLECGLLDESGSSLSRQTVAHIRDEMREYDRARDTHSGDL